MQWEYRFEYIATDPKDSYIEQDVERTARLNQLGNEGWELVCVTQKGSRAYFKRPKAPKLTDSNTIDPQQIAERGSDMANALVDHLEGRPSRLSHEIRRVVADS